jgi:hypothetical protein
MMVAQPLSFICLTSGAEITFREFSAVAAVTTKMANNKIEMRDFLTMVFTSMDRPLNTLKIYGPITEKRFNPY